ncbi:MAG: hypothetical protein HRU18_02805 [Pseudoalteromonas sp.]|uniref:hypothetical protein n=1 Tax=Pseudoalteromonas sp. TaxID=53249 RepID=UPI001DEBCF90|nr:hypothetical protein [Pseudoalteromonas sp.]NRA77114.1 hypothetical protein [Pseudoalteromonas sp.]
MDKHLSSTSTTTTILEPMATPKLLIEKILSGRSNQYIYEIKVTTDNTLIFDYTYDDWDFKVPVICQLIANTYWLVTH